MPYKAYRLGTDPFFGLQLHLVADNKAGIVWAYNERHLLELISYIQAELRINRAPGNSGMFSRLPTWMKVAKNRESVLNSLKKLTMQISTFKG